MKAKKDKVRITLDLTPQFYERLKDLEALVEAGSKANLIRQALQVYEYMALKTMDGYQCYMVGENDQEKVVLPGTLPPQHASRVVA